MHQLSPDEDFSGEEASPTSEESAEASFHFFIKDCEWYAKNGKYGPRLWKSLDEETKAILKNQMMLEEMGYQIKGWQHEHLT